MPLNRARVSVRTYLVSSLSPIECRPGNGIEEDELLGEVVVNLRPKEWLVKRGIIHHDAFPARHQVTAPPLPSYEFSFYM